MTRKHQALSYRHFERSEKSLSFSAHRSMFGNLKRETCAPRHFRASPHLYSAALLLFYAPHHHFAFLISNFSFKRNFHPRLKDAPPEPLPPYCRFLVSLLYYKYHKVLKRRVTMKFLFNHQNFNVLDLEKSIAFYEEALGLTVNRTYKASDGSFILTYMGDMATGFRSSSPGCVIARKPTIWGTMNSIWLSRWIICRKPIRNTRRWAACAMRTRIWASTSSMIRTDTGSRSSREDIDGSDI